MLGASPIANKLLRTNMLWTLSYPGSARLSRQRVLTNRGPVRTYRAPPRWPVPCARSSRYCRDPLVLDRVFHPLEQHSLCLISCWLLNPKAAMCFPSFMQSHEHEHEPFWEEAGLRLQRTHTPSGEKLLFGAGLMHHSLVSSSIRGGICDYSC